jgi:DNA-binding beta-propeller fold protein YncE
VAARQTSVAGIVLALLAAVLAVGCGGDDPRPSGPARLTRGSTDLVRFEYLVVNGAMLVYTGGPHPRLVQRAALPGLVAPRGLSADPRRHALFITYGGYGGATGHGALMKVDLLTGAPVWTRRYGTGVDSPAITRDGARLYLPTGEADPSGTWLVVRTSDGRLVGRVRGGGKAHNTVMSADGSRVYLGGRGSNMLSVASTRTGAILRPRIGPLLAGVRPFTVDPAGRLVFTTATRFTGFQISSAVTGKVMQTVAFNGFRDAPRTYSGDAPSHGLVLTDGGRRVWVIDAPRDVVRVFAVRDQGRARPTPVATVHLTVPVRGQQPRCAGRCVKSGWLQAGGDGRYVYVGDAGDVIDARTFRVVAHLPELERTRQSLEVDWRDGVPVAAGTRNGP